MTTRAPGIPPDAEAALGDLVTYAELIDSPRLARLYSYVLRNGPVGIGAVKEDLELPHSTAYKYVGQLEDAGVLARDEDATPTTVSAEPIQIHLRTQSGTAVATPALVDAVGRATHDEDIELFVERHGVAKLAAALTYTIRVMEGELTQGQAADELGVHRVEGSTVFAALREVIDDAGERRG